MDGRRSRIINARVLIYIYIIGRAFFNVLPIFFDLMPTFFDFCLQISNLLPIFAAVGGSDVTPTPGAGGQRNRRRGRSPAAPFFISSNLK